MSPNGEPMISYEKNDVLRVNFNHLMTRASPFITPTRLSTCHPAYVHTYFVLYIGHHSIQ